MQYRRNLFFILILVLIILSMSFVSAADNSTNDSGNEIVGLHVQDECAVTEENNSKILAENDAQLLGVNNNEAILGAEPTILNFYSGEDPDNIRNAIALATGPTIIYLNNGTYNGRITFDIDKQPGLDPNNLKNTKVEIKDIKIIGGSQNNPNLKATIAPINPWESSINFAGFHEAMPADPKGRHGYYGSSGYDLVNFTIENIYSPTKLFNIGGGSMTNCVIDNCECPYQFFTAVGNYHDKTQIPIINCNFTNSKQTYPGDNGYNDGSGQFGAVFGINMVNCNFINTSSAQHGGALCIADESDWGSARVPSTLTGCNFINITSRWFAIYLHGNFSSSFGYIESPEIIDGCNFINCTGTGEYAGGIGISHNNVIIKNSKFENNYGGQGAAIMVGGLDGAHDGFSGRNYQGNNVTIDNCEFINNIATIAGQTSTTCFELYKKISEGGYTDQPTYDLVDGNYVPNANGEYYLKHPEVTFSPSGDAGAVYVYGNDTKIINSKFNGNKAESGDGSAIYIVGQRTIVKDSKFYNHESKNGTVYIKGDNTKVINSTFEKNYAEQGSAIYIVGSKTNITGSTFEINNAVNGTVYIKGKETDISDSKFIENTADKGAGAYIEGNNTKISKSSIFEDNKAVEGAGVYIKGDDTNISDSTFKENNAVDGAGVYIVGSNTKISNSNTFEKNNATNGAGAYIKGDNTNILSSTFDNNDATNGAGAYINGQKTKIYETTFKLNNVTHQGGAIFIEGSGSNFTNNKFDENEAVPHNASDVSGLGGAIFVKGDNTVTLNNTFEHNKARNGSAIYSTGKKFKLENDVFKENQAWSYLLITVAEPEESYLNTSDVRIEVVHIGGDNMINSIHNNASFEEISLKNVSYIHSSGEKHHTNSTKFEEPVDGVEESNGGKLLYQDDREYLQNITINVTYINGSSKLFKLGRSNDKNSFYEEFLTHLYGDVYFILPKEDLKVGEYNVTATHPEDWNYKMITNTTKFRILPNADLSIKKESDKNIYFDDDIAIWTITVSNGNNASDANNVIVDEVLPSEFEYINSSASQGSYDNHTGIWTIGTLKSGETVTLKIYSKTESIVERMNHFVRLDSNEKILMDKLVVERQSDKDSYDENDHAIWTITVVNNGPIKANNVNVTHLFPFEFEYRNIIEKTKGDYRNTRTGEWFIESIDIGESVTLKLETIATYKDDIITNFISVNYTEKQLNLTVEKQSDKEEYIADDIAKFTIKITNNGGCEATNVVLNDVLQPEFVFNGTYTASMGTYEGATNKWTIPSIAKGASVTLTIYSHTIILRGNVTNYAEVSCKEHEWNYTNNIANKTVEVVPLPQPVKSVSNITPNYNDIIEYNLTISNTGNINYTNILNVTDSLPDGLKFISATVNGADIINQTVGGKSVEYVIDGQKVKWRLTNITNKTSAIITVKVQIVGLGNIINNATVINSIYNLANDTALINKLINLTNNVTFMKKLMDSTNNNTFIRSLINLTNDGASFNMLIELVNNKTYVKAIGDLTNETMRNALTDLTKNNVDINYVGNLTNKLTVTGPNGTDVIDTCSVYPKPIVDLSVNKTSDREVYFTDDIAIWTIVISNAANGTNATNVTLKDVFPFNEFEFIKCNATNGTQYNANANIWYIGFIENGTNVTLKIYSRAKYTNNIINATNNVTVNCNETDWNKTNNKDNATVKVAPLPEPIKTVNNIAPYYNDIIEYNLTIVNKGGVTYINVLNVTDSLPDGLKFINATVNGANVINQTVGGESVEYIVTVKKLNGF